MQKIPTAVITREESTVVSFFSEIDVASQCDSIKDNLQETVELFFECSSNDEVKNTLVAESYISVIKISVG